MRLGAPKQRARQQRGNTPARLPPRPPRCVRHDTHHKEAAVLHADGSVARQLHGAQAVNGLPLPFVAVHDDLGRLWVQHKEPFLLLIEDAIHVHKVGVQQVRVNVLGALSGNGRSKSPVVSAVAIDGWRAA